MSKKDDSFFVMFVGGKPDGGGDDGGGPAGVFLGLLAIALAMIFFASLLRDAERQQQNYYPQNYSPRSDYLPTSVNSLPRGAGSSLLPCSKGL